MVVTMGAATVGGMDRIDSAFGDVLTAVATPFDTSGAVDFDSFFKLLRHLADNGSDGVVVAGTTGESYALDADEKADLFAAAVDAVGGRMSVVANTGTYNTRESIELTERAAGLGVHGVMAVTPYYARPPQAGLLAHFTAIADASPLPMLVYNIPSRTARLIEVDTLVELAGHPRIVGVKDAVEDITFTREFLTRAPAGFSVYAGSDHMTLPICAAGGVGVISVASHLAGPQLRRLVTAARAGDLATAETIDAALQPLFRALFLEPSPMPLKAALEKLWGSVGDPRLPLVRASDATLAEIESALGAASAV